MTSKELAKIAYNALDDKKGVKHYYYRYFWNFHNSRLFHNRWRN